MRTLKTVGFALVLTAVGLFALQAYAAQVTCPQCGGSGTIPGPVIHGLPSVYGCPRCGGSGGGGSPGTPGRGYIIVPDAPQPDASNNPSADDEAARRAAQAEKDRREAELEAQRQKQREEQRLRDEAAAKAKQEAFDRAKAEALKTMKGLTDDKLGAKDAGNDLGLKGLEDPKLGNGTKDMGLKGLDDDRTAPAKKPDKVTSYTVQIGSAKGAFSIVNSDGSRLTDANIKTGEATLVDSGTRVTTGPNARVQFVLPDETVFILGPNSDMVLDEFVYDPDNTPKKITARLSKGIFRWVTGKTARKNPASMKVTLPAGGTGIRGTDFEDFVDADGSGYVKLFSGELEITPNKGGAMFVMQEKTMVTFKADGTFSQPEPLQQNVSLGPRRTP